MGGALVVVLILAVCVVATIGIGLLLGVSGWARRLRSGAVGAVHRLIGRVGALAAGPLLLAGGVAVTLGVCYPLGRLAAALEDGVDWPVFGYFVVRLHAGWWKDLNELLTLMGNRPQIKVSCVVAGVVLAVVWRRRGWYIPPVAIAATFVVEKYAQKFLAVTVHRGHPPTTLGTYPSGGCARLITVYGIILFLALAAAPALARSWRVALWTALATATTVEAYTRTYLLKHWFTDVVGGLVFGAMVLATMAAATTALIAFHNRRNQGPPAGSVSDAGAVASRTGEVVAG